MKLDKLIVRGIDAVDFDESMNPTCDDDEAVIVVYNIVGGVDNDNLPSIETPPEPPVSFKIVPLA